MSRYPQVRLRRLRRTQGLRRMFEAPLPGPARFIWPVFVSNGKVRREPIAALPGQSRLSVEALLEELAPVVESGIGGILVFGLEQRKPRDAAGTAASAGDGVVQEAVRAVREAFPALTVFTDVCLCAYTAHGHCGPLCADGSVDNDAANGRLAEVAVSHAAAGAHGVAPSAMMDGQVAAVRAALDAAGHGDTLIMSYSTKFASSLYGPFREAEHSAPGRGDRRGYQAAPGDPKAALRESRLDEAEGADILMVKPALFYLDVIARLRRSTELPLAAYNVSGEYAMLHACAERGWGELRPMVRESVRAIDRAGADLIVSYWANRYGELLA